MMPNNMASFLPFSQRRASKTVRVLDFSVFSR